MPRRATRRPLLRRPTPGATPLPRELADQLHSAAIHLLRRVRAEDAGTGLAPPQASALSVLVFGGRQTLSGLAQAEQVKPPTMSRLVRDMERNGLVDRVADLADRRIQWISATSKAQRLMLAGRARRVARLEADLERLSARDYRALVAGAAVLARVARPPGHPF